MRAGRTARAAGARARLGAALLLGALLETANAASARLLHSQCPFQDALNARYVDICLAHEAVAFGGPAAPAPPALRGWGSSALADAFDALDGVYAGSSVDAIAERAIAAFLQPDPISPRPGHWALARGGRRFLPGAAARSGAPGIVAQACLCGVGAAITCVLLLFGALACVVGDDQGASESAVARAAPRGGTSGPGRALAAPPEDASRRRARRPPPSPASSASSGVGSSLPPSPLRTASLRACLVRVLDAASSARVGAGSPAAPPCSPARASGAALSSAGSSAFPGPARGARRTAERRGWQVDDSVIVVSSDSDEERGEGRRGEVGARGPWPRPTRSFPSARPRTALLAALRRSPRLEAVDGFASALFPFPVSFSPLAARPACSEPPPARGGVGGRDAGVSEEEDDVVLVSERSAPGFEVVGETTGSSARLDRALGGGGLGGAGAEGRGEGGVGAEDGGGVEVKREAGRGGATCASVKEERPDFPGEPILTASRTHEE